MTSAIANDGRIAQWFSDLNGETFTQRFMIRVEIKDRDQCWRWKGGLDAKG